MSSCLLIGIATADGDKRTAVAALCDWRRVRGATSSRRIEFVAVAAEIGESLDLLRQGHAVVAVTMTADQCEPERNHKR